MLTRHGLRSATRAMCSGASSSTRRPVAFSVVPSFGRATPRCSFFNQSALVTSRRFFSDELGAVSSKSSKKSGGPPAGPPPVTLDTSAVKRLQHLEQTLLKKPIALRLLVQSGGCSGFEYKLSIDEKWNAKNDILVEQDGVRFVTDEVSVTFLEDATIGYVEDMIRAAFQVTNNKVADNACSCGDSFNVAF